MSLGKNLGSTPFGWKRNIWSCGIFESCFRCNPQNETAEAGKKFRRSFHAILTVCHTRKQAICGSWQNRHFTHDGSERERLLSFWIPVVLSRKLLA